MAKLKKFMQKNTLTLRNINWAYLSVFLPILILAFVIVLRYCFEIYIAVNVIQVVDLYKTVIPAIGVFGVVLSVLGLQSKANSEIKSRTRVMSLIGALLNLGLLYSAYIVDVPAIKGTIMDIYVYENRGNDPDLSVSVEVSIDLSTSKFDENFFDNSSEPILVVHISKDTTIYEQVGYWRWQNKVLGVDQLKANQYVEVKYDGMIFVTDPGQIYATEVIVRNK
jgi:hypothetical protein